MGKKWTNKGKLTIKQRKEIVALYFDNYTVLSIAAKYNIDHTTIYYYLDGRRRPLNKKKNIKKLDVPIRPEPKVICKNYNPAMSKYKCFIPRKKQKTYKEYLAESKERTKKEKND